MTEGYFVDKGVFENLREGRELLNENREWTEDNKAMLRDALEMLAEETDPDRRKDLEEKIEGFKEAIEEATTGGQEIAEAYDELYKEVYGQLPN